MAFISSITNRGLTDTHPFQVRKIVRLLFLPNFLVKAYSISICMSKTMMRCYFPIFSFYFMSFQPLSNTPWKTRRRETSSATDHRQWKIRQRPKCQHHCIQEEKVELRDLGLPRQQPRSSPSAWSRPSRGFLTCKRWRTSASLRWSRRASGRKRKKPPWVI